jgi:hypothetical protein
MIVENDEIILQQPEHVYRETKSGIVLPGVTTILKAKGWIDDRWYNETARLRGTAVHLAIHFLEKGTLDPFSIDPVVEPYIQSYEGFKAISGFRVVYHEKLVFHPIYRYAGSLDAVGILNGQEVILDYKTGEVQPWAALQLAAYNACLPPSSTGGLRKRFGLRLFGDGSPARLEPFTDPMDEQVFFADVGSYYSMLKKGVIKQAA